MNRNYYQEVEEKIHAGLYEVGPHPTGHSEVWTIFSLIYNEDKAPLNNVVFCKKCKKLYSYNRYNIWNLKQHICFIRSKFNPIVRYEGDQIEEVRKNISTGVYKVVMDSKRKKNLGVWKMFGSIINEKGVMLKKYAYCPECKDILPIINGTSYELLRHKCYLQLFSTVKHQNSQTGDRDEHQTAAQDEIERQNKAAILNKIHKGVYELKMEQQVRNLVWKFFALITRENGNVLTEYAFCLKCEEVCKSEHTYLRSHKCFRESEIKINMNKIVEDKIKRGIYKLKDNHLSTSEISTKFALISILNSSIIEDMVCCRQCKMVLEYDKQDEFNLEQHKCWNADEESTGLSAKLRSNLSPSYNRKEQNKRKAEIRDKISKGIYKFKMRENLSNSPVWKTYAVIVNADDTIIDNYVYCIKCKIIIYQRGRKSNMYTHSCYQIEKQRGGAYRAVEENIKTGIYKLKDNHDTKSPIWTKFARILNDDDTIINGIVCCRRCKLTLKYREQNDEDNLRLHKCPIILEREREDEKMYKTKILQNIDKEIYKLKMKKDCTEDVIWKIFAMIEKDDGFLLNNYVCCTKCRMVMKYDGTNQRPLSQHRCCRKLNISTLIWDEEESATVSNNQKEDVTIIQSSESNSTDMSDSDESELINYNFEQHSKNTNSTIWSRFEHVSDDDGCIMNGVVCCCQCKMLLNYDGTTTIQLELHKCFTMASTLDPKIVEDFKNNDHVDSPPKRMKPVMNPVNEQTDDSHAVTINKEFENYSYTQNEAEYPKFINELNSMASTLDAKIDEDSENKVHVNSPFKSMKITQTVNEQTDDSYSGTANEEFENYSYTPNQNELVYQKFINKLNDFQSLKTKSINEVEAQTLTVMQNLNNECYPIYIKKEIYEIDLHSSKIKEHNEVEEEGKIDDIDLHSSKTKEINEVEAQTLAAMPNIVNESYANYITKDVDDTDMHSNNTKEINEVEEQPLAAVPNLVNAFHPNYNKNDIDIQSNTTKEPLAIMTNLTYQSSYSIYNKNKNENNDSLCNERVKDKEETINICTQYCVEDFVAPSVVEGLGFCKLIKYWLQHGAKYNVGNLDMEYAVTDSMTISKHIQQETEAQRKKVESIIKDISDKIVISIDTWTDYIAKRFFFSFTLHFVKDCKLNDIVLGTKSVDFSQSTEKIIQNKLEHFLRKWKIDSLKNVVLVTEANSFIDKSLRGVCTLLKCSTYLFEKVLNSALENTTELNDIIRCCNVILKYFNETNQSAIKNAKHCKINHYSKLKLITLNWTDINESLLTNNKEKLKISDASLSQLQNIIKLCRKFELIFKHLQATSTPSLCFVIPSIQRLQILSDTNSNDGPEIKALKSNLLKYLQEIWLNNISIWHKAACFLYPPANQQQEKDLNEIKDFCLKEMKVLTPIQTENNDNCPSNSKDKADITLKETDDFDFFFPNLKKTIDTTNSNAAEEEINCYCREKIMIHKNFNALQWWRHNSTKYPLLSRLALQILSIPASGKGSKRFLSLATNLVNKNPQTLDSIVFLNSMTPNKS